MGNFILGSFFWSQNPITSLIVVELIPGLFGMASILSYDLFAASGFNWDIAFLSF